jgi:hypothetical protein
MTDALNDDTAGASKSRSTSLGSVSDSDETRSSWAAL